MSRWAETEELAEQWFRAHGWPYATRRGRAGHIDIENMPGLLPEVKSGEVWETRWLKTPAIGEGYCECGHPRRRHEENEDRRANGCLECLCPLLWEPRLVGPIKFILWRPPKFGPASVGSWPMVFRAEEATRLLREAGYGDASS